MQSTIRGTEGGGSLETIKKPPRGTRKAFFHAQRAKGTVADIGKRQPAGKLETKKCVDKLFTLREKIKGKSRGAQLRAASGRLITDLEMNSTYRGAVEVVNLCRNLRPHDVLFAECIRTFGSQTTDGRSWMYRLEQQEKNFNDFKTTTYVPPTPRPNVRTKGSRVNEMDAYGFRPLRHPWQLLSPYEFMRQWRCVPLLVHDHYKFRGDEERTERTEKGRRFIAEACAVPPTPRPLQESLPTEPVGQKKTRNAQRLPH